MERDSLPTNSNQFRNKYGVPLPWLWTEIRCGDWRFGTDLTLDQWHNVYHQDSVRCMLENKEVRPTFMILTEESKVWTFGIYWSSLHHKEIAAQFIRAFSRVEKAIAVYFTHEAWAVTAAPGEVMDEQVSLAKHPNRVEILACYSEWRGQGSRLEALKIKREGDIIDLEPMMDLGPEAKKELRFTNFLNDGKND